MGEVEVETLRVKEYKQVLFTAGCDFPELYQTITTHK